MIPRDRPPSMPPGPSVGPSALEVPPNGAGLPRAGEPAPPGSFNGRASSFRKEEAKRRRARRERVVVILAAAIIVLGIYTVLTARPYSSSLYELPSPGPVILVHLGTPSVGTLACSAGGTATVERIPWTNSTKLVSTKNFVVHVTEIWDGDYIGDPNVVANVTSSNLCAGVAPDSTTKWYVVLTAPNGTNLLTYTVAGAWASVSQGPSNIEIENNSALDLVTYTSLAGTGRGLVIAGIVNGSLIRGVVPL
jgi:hypothetical protein